MLKEDILLIQEEWGNGVVQIGKNELDAKNFVNKMYASEVLMKPTMAKEQAFRMSHLLFHILLVDTFQKIMDLHSNLGQMFVLRMKEYT